MGLMAGRLAGRQSDKILVDLNFFKCIVTKNFDITLWSRSSIVYQKSYKTSQGIFAVMICHLDIMIVQKVANWQS